MSAPNFAKNNAEDYYCVGMNREEDEWIDWDEMREDIFQVAKSESDFWSKEIVGKAVMAETTNCTMQPSARTA